MPSSKVRPNASTAVGAASDAPKSKLDEVAGGSPKLPAESSPTQYAVLEPSPDTPVAVTVKLPALAALVLWPLDFTSAAVGVEAAVTVQYTVAASLVVPETVTEDEVAWAALTPERVGAVVSGTAHSHAIMVVEPTGPYEDPCSQPLMLFRGNPRELLFCLYGSDADSR